MAKTKKPTDMEVAQGILLGYVNVLDAAFAQATGKTIKQWLEEFRRQPAPIGQEARKAIDGTEMTLDWAFAIMGLPMGAPHEEVTRRYRVLSKVYHPDMPGGYDGAFKILDRAYKRILKEKKK